MFYISGNTAEVSKINEELHGFHYLSFLDHVIKPRSFRTNPSGTPLQEMRVSFVAGNSTDSYKSFVEGSTPERIPYTAGTPLQDTISYTAGTATHDAIPYTAGTTSHDAISCTTGTGSHERTSFLADTPDRKPATPGITDRTASHAACSSSPKPYDFTPQLELSKIIHQTSSSSTRGIHQFEMIKMEEDEDDEESGT